MSLFRRFNILMIICVMGLAWPLSLAAAQDSQDTLKKLKIINQKLDDMESRLGLKDLSTEKPVDDQKVVETLTKPEVSVETSRPEPVIERKFEPEPAIPVSSIEDVSDFRLKLLDSQTKNQLLGRQVILLEDEVKGKELVIDGLQRELVSVNSELEREKAVIADIETGNRKSSKSELLSRIKDLESRLNMAQNLNCELYCRVGEACLRLKMYRESLWAYSRAADFPGVDPKVYYYAGLLYQYSGGQPDKAVMYLQKYLKQEPEGIYAKKAEELLGSAGATGEK